MMGRALGAIPTVRHSLNTTYDILQVEEDAAGADTTADKLLGRLLTKVVDEIGSKDLGYYDGLPYYDLDRTKTRQAAILKSQAKHSLFALGFLSILADNALKPDMDNKGRWTKIFEAVPEPVIDTMNVSTLTCVTKLKIQLDKNTTIDTYLYDEPTKHFRPFDQKMQKMALVSVYSEWDQAAAKGVLPYLQDAVYPWVYTSDVLQNAANADHWRECQAQARRIVLDAVSAALNEAMWPEWKEKNPEYRSPHKLLRDLGGYMDEKMIGVAEEEMYKLRGLNVSYFPDAITFVEAFDSQMKTIQTTGRKLVDSSSAPLLLFNLSKISDADKRWVMLFKRHELGGERIVTYAESLAAALERYENYMMPYREFPEEDYSYL